MRSLTLNQMAYDAHLTFGKRKPQSLISTHSRTSGTFPPGSGKLVAASSLRALRLMLERAFRLMHVGARRLL
jgi:hypothetical protein